MSTCCIPIRARGATPLSVSATQKKFPSLFALDAVFSITRDRTVFYFADTCVEGMHIALSFKHGGYLCKNQKLELREVRQPKASNK